MIKAGKPVDAGARRSSSRCSSRATSSSTAATPSSQETRRREATSRRRASTSSAWASRAARRARVAAPRSCRAATPRRGTRSRRSSRRSRRRPTRARASPTSARTAPGHFVKMVHNGIEYGDMQLIAEAYDLLSRAAGPGDAARSADIFAQWNQGDARSLPRSRSRRKVLRVKDAETGQAAGRSGAGQGRPEGHRQVDGAESRSTSASPSRPSPPRSTRACSRA